ncbi:MAG: protein kinase [Planctomycetota bacterium]
MSIEHTEIECAAASAFEEVVDLSPADRALRLDALDAHVRSRVLELLAADERASGFLEAKPARDDAIGSVLRGYELTAIIGEGGMGRVYRGERVDGAFDRSVAIKLIRPGLVGRDLVARLERERRLLASVEHPGVVRLLDAGIADHGEPFLIMSLVEGTRLDDYADTHTLDTRERVGLVKQVADAVAAAHAAMVVHRDLKPANVLVTDGGEARLLDFGIAKSLDTASDHTQTQDGARRMTLAYASPEQIKGEPITAASDVYALGVMLYELLAGKRPFEVATLPWHEACRVICETTPPKPSVVAEIELGRDLDAIIMRAMAREPARRYSSAERFADDLRRWLEGRPVEARPDSAAYRASRFAGRHPLAVGAAGLALLASMTAAGVFAWQAGEIRAERDAARERFDMVRTLANEMIFGVHDKLVELEGSTENRRAVAKTAAAYLAELGGQSTGDAELLRELAAAHQRLAQVFGGLTSGSTGDTDLALDHARQAVALFEEAELIAGETTDSKASRASGLVQLGSLQQQAGELAAAEETFERATRIATGYDRAAAELRIGSIRLLRGDGSADTEQRFGRAETILAGLIAAGDDSDRTAQSHATAAEKLGDLAVNRDDPEAALAKYRAALDTRRAIAERSGNTYFARRALAIGLGKVADVLGHPSYPNVGDEPASLAAYQEALEIGRAMAATDPADMSAKQVEAYFERRTGTLHSVLGDHAAARACIDRSLELTRERVAADPGSGGAKLDLASVLMLSNDFHAAAGEPGNAAELREVIAIADEILGVAPDYVNASLTAIDAERALARTLAETDRSAAADAARSALSRLRALDDRGVLRDAQRSMIGETEALLAELLADFGT